VTHCRGARRDFGKHLLARDEKAIEIKHADVAELVDASDLKSPATLKLRGLFA
jgi:hypothetical protein